MPSRIRSRTAAIVASTAASALMLAGCAGGVSATPSGEVGEPVSGGTLTVEYIPDNPSLTCIDPFQVYWLESRQIIRNFADSLTDQDPETGEIVPWLATGWQISDDALTYTFELRDDVTFSDGTAFDAASVVTALENAKATAAAVPGVYGAIYIAGYDSSVALDAHTVQVDFSTPNAAFLQGTSTTNLAILAPSAYDFSAQERCLGAGLVGSGPFVLDRYSPSDGTDLSRREGYAWASELNAHDGNAYLDAVHINYVAEDSVRVGNLASGASDVAWPRNPFTPEQIAQLEASGASVQSRSLPGPAYDYYPNVAPGKVLADPDVRAAVQTGIDRAQYAATIYGPDYPVVAGIYDSTTPYALDQSAELAYDPEASGRLLDDAGWTWEEGAEYREKDGQPLRILLPIAADNPGDALLQDQLKQIGVHLELKVIQASERASVIASGDYDLQGTYMTRADPAVLGALLDPRTATSKAIAVNAAAPEVSQRLQDLFTEGLTTVDAAEREGVYADIQRLVLEENALFPIFERVQQAAVAPRVQGFRFTSEAFLSYYDIWLSEQG